jgi:hypothetical protein
MPGAAACHVLYVVGLVQAHIPIATKINPAGIMITDVLPASVLVGRGDLPENQIPGF